MSNATETLVVEKLTQYGVRIAGVNYSYSKYCNKDVKLKAGDIIEAEIYVGAKGGKYLNSYNVVGTEDTTPTPPVVKATGPSLPPTSVTKTEAPGGTAPVAPAVKKTQNKDVDADKMSKADWAAKDVAIERVAIVKSVLESPAFAQLAVGKRVEDVLEVGSVMIDFFLNKLNSLK